MTLPFGDTLLRLLEPPTSTDGRQFFRSIDQLLESIAQAVLASRQLPVPPANPSGELERLHDALNSMGNAASDLRNALPLRLYRSRFDKKLREIRELAFGAATLADERRLNPAADGPLRLQMNRLGAGARRLSRTRDAALGSHSWFTQRRVLLGLTIVTAIATYYLNSLSGMVQLSQAVVFPPGPFRTSGERYVLSSHPQDSYRYFAEFSEYFFRWDDRNDVFLERHFAPARSPAPDAPPPVSGAAFATTQQDNENPRVFAQKWQVELKNASYLRSEFLARVTLNVELERAADFPWEKLHVTPDIRCRFDVADSSTPPWAQIIAGNVRLPERELLPVVRFASVAAAPGLDVNSRIVADSGLLILERTTPVIHKHAEQLDFAVHAIGGALEAGTRRLVLGKEERSEDFDVVVDGVPERRQEIIISEFPTTVAGSPQFYPPLYFRHTSSPNGRQSTFVHEGTTYEPVDTLKRLRELTDVAWDEGARLELTYKSLSGVIHRKVVHFDLPNWLAYYAPRKDLLWYDPREGAPKYFIGYQVSRAYPAIAEVFAPPKVEPIGDVLIVVGHSVDLWSTTEGQSRQQIAQVARFLKPQGRLVLEIDAIGVRSGRYRVRVLVNEIMSAQFSVDVLAPERFYFDDDLELSERIQSAFRSSYAPGGDR